MGSQSEEPGPEAPCWTRVGLRYRLAQASLGFVQLADVFENLAAGRRRFVSRRFVLGMTDEAAQVLTIV